MSGMTKHEFGGVWTRVKLSILQDYVHFFTTALRRKGFKLHYADAFAGTGTQSAKTKGGHDLLIPSEDFEGSVRVALGLKHPFDVYHFNDLSSEHVSELKRLASDYPEREVRVTQLDANDFVKDFCASLTHNDRAILFIDPYSTELEWETLHDVALSGRIDLWMLFPLSALLRMTPKGGVKPEWEEKLNKLLGTDQWIKELYRPKPSPQIEDLFGAEVEDETERLNVEGVSNYIRSRLMQQFPYAAQPVTLYNNGHPLFLFCFAVSNNSKVAIALAEKVARSILTKRNRLG
ncbi:hypothetical protein GCM10009113_06720 [Marinobacter szutsaonensis]